MAESTRSLTALLRQGTVAERHEALTELLLRDDARPALLTEVASDATQPADVRATAVVALAKADRAPVRATVIDLVADPEPVVARRAIEAVGRIGRPEDLDRLERVRTTTAPTRRALGFARALLSYRHGLDRHVLAMPPPQDRLDRPTGARPMDVASVRAPLLERVARDVSPDLPAVALAATASSAVRATCAGVDHLIVLTEAGRRALRRLPSSPVVLAVVLKHTDSAGRWFLHEYVFAQPAGDGEVQLIGARSAGTVVHAGRLVPADDGSAIFALQGVASSLRNVSEVAGTIQLGAEPRLAIADAAGFRVDRRPGRTPERASSAVA